ncbi:hypothetical protein LEP1GSC041_0053 [Leptospira noguchii str. 2006001870]|nr:hypothetical protein LEP1GSC041_0053 [Leptospira noguchii str. 2006001870]
MLILREAIRWVSWVVRQIAFYNKLESGKDFIFIRIHIIELVTLLSNSEFKRED